MHCKSSLNILGAPFRYDEIFMGKVTISTKMIWWSRINAPGSPGMNTGLNIARLTPTFELVDFQGCLRRSPKERYTIPQLLAHPFINSSAQGNTPSFSDLSVEIDSDRMFDCLMEFSKADVNSPRSIRALSQVTIYTV